MQGTSKSEQFWHRPSGSSLALHLMLRLLQKSPKRLRCQSRVRGSAKHAAKWSKLEQADENVGNGVQALETRCNFRGFCDIQFTESCHGGSQDTLGAGSSNNCSGPAR